MAGPIPETALGKQILKRRTTYNGKELLKVLWEYYPGKPTGYVSFEARQNLVTWGKATEILRKFDGLPVELFWVCIPGTPHVPAAKSHSMRTRSQCGSTSYEISPGK